MACAGGQIEIDYSAAERTLRAGRFDLKHRPPNVFILENYIYRLSF
jgi:hypothetical protein